MILKIKYIVEKFNRKPLKVASYVKLFIPNKNTQAQGTRSRNNIRSEKFIHNLIL